jgi:radical SAM protein with 4Fe4S-binding SPASM domain
MQFPTARRAIDQLCDPTLGLSVGFFGGEPLLNMKLIRDVIEYCEHLASTKGPICKRCQGSGTTRGEKCSCLNGRERPSFHVTTNGTLYSPDNINFLNDHGFSLITSIDGDEESHDALRPMKRSGSGSYKNIIEGLKRLSKFKIAQRNTLRSTFTYLRTTTIRDRLEHLNQMCDDGHASHVSVEPAALSENTCFVGSTKVRYFDQETSLGKVMTLHDMYHMNIKPVPDATLKPIRFNFISYAKGNPVNGITGNVSITNGTVNLVARGVPVVRVWFGTGGKKEFSEKCTPDHIWYTSRGEVRADALLEGDVLISVKRSNEHLHIHEDYSVATVDILSDLEDVYCPSIDDPNHNWALESGPIVANCFIPNQDEIEIHIGNVWNFYDEYLEAADWWIDRANSGKYPRWHNVHKSLERIFWAIHAGTECGAGVGYVGVNSKGEIFGCHRESNSFLGTLVTGIDEKLRAPWLDNRIYNRTGCMTCGHRYACGGGCREDSLGDKGNIHEPSNVHCAFKDMWVRCAMWIMANCPKKVISQFVRNPQANRAGATTPLLSWIPSSALPRDHNGIVQQKWVGNIPITALIKEGYNPEDHDGYALQDRPVDMDAIDVFHNPALPENLLTGILLK